tara:strand:- start:285 stop:434 length:150 start_codon:yes stop_codon:yes gene_type:complete
MDWASGQAAAVVPDKVQIVVEIQLQQIVVQAAVAVVTLTQDQAAQAEKV